MCLGVGEDCADARVVGAPGAAEVFLPGRGMGSGLRELIGKKSREGVWEVICRVEHDRVEDVTPSIGGVAELASYSAVV